MKEKQLNLSLIGLGKMGEGLFKNLKRNNYEVTGFDLDKSKYESLKKEGFKLADKLEDLIDKSNKKQNVVFVSVPCGKPTNDTIKSLLKLLPPKSIIVDTGNSFYKETLENNKKAKAKDVYFVDCGTSGGPSGALNGACMMVGAEQAAINVVGPILKKLCVKNGYLHTGEVGSGHFCKMVHNGIEYGIMQSIAEGFQVLYDSEYEFDLLAVSKLYNNGSVIRSWLMELMGEVFKNKKELEDISGIVNASGEGLWTVQTALDQGTPVPAIASALFARQTSLKQPDLYANKLLASLRNKFGGHSFTKKK
ncbi:phosphogluconate dehydrogenase (NAD(+)-dependent, decarboxylating) [Mycoplasma sp. E35C]|uniref:phosphogluconate dehydrogenase (NAD(+)-dependent, decarboxylating) n=1 Tax=Mycoplasma sp. E35C TaxID=2801918 RepID=UPI001CA41953|nr:decarboxylating 6-phosphogluconate dehydrogenase [Mycoplasma sp. E35C]QZX49516.1 decarboxylating 6-phosphogluconate dehydrogenase [Mycoplasma sp. E35C]